MIPETMALNNVDKLKLIIRNLLQTVRETHGIVTIEPQLKTDDFDHSNRGLSGLCPSHDLKVVVECATKSILYEIAVWIPSTQTVMGRRWLTV